MEEKQTFPNKQKLRKLITTRPALQEMVKEKNAKGILWVKEKDTNIIKA